MLSHRYEVVQKVRLALVTSRWYLLSNPNCISSTARTKEQITSKAVSHLKITKIDADQFSLTVFRAWSFASKPQRLKEDL